MRRQTGNGESGGARRVRALRRGVLAWVLGSLALWTAGCVSTMVEPPPPGRYVVVPMTLTGYCNCGKCCGWHRTWFGLGPAVVDAGPARGQPKRVGYTSSGTQARHGTIAADTSRYPYGTVVYVPGYGYGRVEDTGGAIQGDHMDLWFADHDEAMRWGKQRRLVKIWLPYAGR